MKVAIRKYPREFLAIIGLVVLAAFLAVYLLDQQRFRFPIVESAPKHVEIQLSDAQAVEPGQGQTVRVAGIEVGRISGVKLRHGVAVVDIELDHKYDNLIREDATALLRPKTALKDMFIEVSPGTGKVVPDGGSIPAANTLPDVDPDEILGALDADTRPYFRLLVSGLGEGLRGRGQDLRETFRRLEPIHRDLARVNRATAARREALKRLVHEYGLLVDELGKRPNDLRRLVTASRSVFSTLADQEQNISTAVERLPGTLQATQRAFAEVRGFAPLLQSTLNSLREPVRQLPATNAALTPFLRDTTPVIRTQLRPFVRTARPFTDDLRVAAQGLAQAAPDLNTALGETNRFFNIGAYNPGGAQGLGGLSIAQQRARSEGLLYWLAWTAQNGVSLFSTADPQGPWRRVTICNVPGPFLTALIQQVLVQVNQTNPSLVEQLIGGPGNVIQPGSPIDNVLSTGFGSCSFGTPSP